MDKVIAKAFADELEKISGPMMNRVGRVGAKMVGKFMEPYRAAAKGMAGAAQKVIPPKAK